MEAKRPLRERLRTWKRSLRDPLRGGKSAAHWIAVLPTGDPLQVQSEVLELVASFPGGRRRLGPAQAEALLHIDARCEPILSQLTAQGLPARFIENEHIALDIDEPRDLERFLSYGLTDGEATQVALKLLAEQYAGESPPSGDV